MIADNIATQVQDAKPVPPTAVKTASKRSFADLLAIVPTPTRTSDKSEKTDKSENIAQTFRRKPKDATEDSNAGAAAVAGTSVQVQPTTTQATAVVDAAAKGKAASDIDAAEAAAKLAALAAGKDEVQKAAGPVEDAAAPAHNSQAGVAPPPNAADLGVKVAAGAKKLISQPGAALAHVSPIDARFGKSDETEAALQGPATGTTKQDAAKALEAVPEQTVPTQNASETRHLPSAATLANEAAAAHAATQSAKSQEGEAVATKDTKTDDIATPSAVPFASNLNTPQVQETAKPVTTQRAAPPPPPVLEQVAVNLKQAVSGGLDQIEIQLRPASLGAIQVKLNLTHDGKVTAAVTADRSDTLQLLQRDASGLQQALRDAGLQADSNSLSFNLRGDPGTGQQQFAQAQGNGGRSQGGGSGNSGRFLSNGDDAGAALAAASNTNRSSHAGRLDIQV